MSLRINQNITSLNAHRYLSSSDAGMSKSIERLSSGFRINSAADDAAGLAISEGLRTQVSGLGVATQNTQYGINMIKTAEKALDEVTTQLRSMRDLTLHAANSNGNAQAIAADNTQIQKAIESIDRIASQTQYANMKLLNSNTAGDSINGAVFQIGANAGEKATFSITGMKYDSTTANVNTNMHTTQLLNNGTDRIGVVTSKVAASLDASGDMASAENLQFTAWNGSAVVEFTVAVSAGDTKADVATNITSAADTAGAYVKAQWTKADGSISMNDEENTYLSLSTIADDGAGTVTEGSGAEYFLTASSDVSTGASGVGTLLSAQGADGATFELTSTMTSAQFDDALNTIDEALKSVTGLRVALGAFQKNTLESNLASVGVAKENLTASESDIRDTDMAAEMVNFTRNQILMQAASSMMTQANQAPQSILQMLR